MTVEPDNHVEEPPTKEGSKPTGLTVGVKVPQEGTLTEGGRAPSAVKATTVTLPKGLLLNAGAANGLLACSPGPLGVREGFSAVQAVTENNAFAEGVPHCVDESELLSPAERPEAEKRAKVGTFTIKTPLLDEPLPGSVYIGTQDTGSEPAEEAEGRHFNPPLVVYLIVNDPKTGIRVKLAGAVSIDPVTGQLSSTFKNTPQLPFEELKLHFLEEGKASVTTPATCGIYTTTSAFTPWAQGVEAAEPGASFEINSGPNGLPCAPPLPLSPSITAGTAPSPTGTNLAGHFSNLSVVVSRPDGDEALTGLNVTLPPGIAGVLANVTPCAEPQAAEGTCGEESLVGHATTVSGLGNEPFTLRGGKVFLTEAYGGGPYGLSIVFANIVAGPFHVGTVVVRSSIFVDENTAQVTVKTAVPTFVETVPGHVRKGIPVQLKQTNVETLGTLPSGKPFEFNPTNCSPLGAVAAFTGEEGATSQAPATLQFAGCEKLEFNPGFEAEVEGQGSKPNGVGFKVITTSKGIGVANIHRVHVALPIQLPSRLTTIQQACVLKTFDEGAVLGEKCNAGSNIGSAHIETPVLKNPLTGPAYLVSHGNEEFPDVEFVLKGTGTPGESAIKLVLDGKTDIKKGITYSTFESTPDAPFTRFETTLPAGPHSAFTANVPESKHFNLCGEKLVIPTELTGQNGVLIQENTIVKVTGCKGPAKLTKAQLLAKALASCRKRFKHNKHKRVACERSARKKYGPKKKTSHKGKKAAHRATRAAHSATRSVVRLHY